jgi:transposase
MTTANQKKVSISGDSPSRTPRTRRLPKVHDEITGYGIGMDIHKDSIATCIRGRTPTGEILILKEHTYQNNHRGVKELCAFLKPYAPKAQFLMECTGVYHVAIYRALETQFPTRKEKIIAMNPLLVHNRIADLGSKTDRADARVLASLAFYEDILRPSYVGSAQFFATRDLMRSYHRNATQITRYKNRIHRHLHLANQKFPFDLNKEWALQLLDRYISNGWTFEECFNTFLSELKAEGKGRVLEKHAIDVIPNAEISLTESQRFLLQLDFLRLLQNQQSGAILLKEAENHVLSHQGLVKHYEHMSIIPGFSSVTILTVLTEVGDYSRFRNANAFSKFCGVVPTVEQSGTFKSKGHVNRYTNKHLRHVLSQAAGVVTGRPNQNTDIGAFAYRQYHIRKMPFKKTMLKVAQKYSRILYGMFNEIRSYDPHYETILKKKQQLQRRMARKHTLLDSNRTRALRRDISKFLVSNSEFLNSTGHYHLVSGFKRLIRKAQYKDQSKSEKE